VTDYRTFEAVIRILKDYAGSLSFGDSPGFGKAEKAAKSAGLMEVAQRYGVAFDPFETWQTVLVPEHFLVSSFDVATAALDADVLISLPRLKTHGMTSYTGAIKNQFGCIPGLKKANWHSRMPKAKDFSDMLLDINRVVDTKFAILDGIVAMEGNGPKNGSPRKMNTLIMGESLSAVDALAATLIGYDPLEIPYLKQAYKRKVGPVLLDDFEIMGESVDSMKPDHFVRIRGKNHMSFQDGGRWNKWLRDIIAPKPILVPHDCISCRRCAEICPESPNVISFYKDGERWLPAWQYDSCIRCFCCQEICPAGAIKIEYPPLAKWLKMDQ